MDVPTPVFNSSLPGREAFLAFVLGDFDLVVRVALAEGDFDLDLGLDLCLVDGDLLRDLVRSPLGLRRVLR